MYDLEQVNFYVAAIFSLIITLMCAFIVIPEQISQLRRANGNRIAKLLLLLFGVCLCVSNAAILRASLEHLGFLSNVLHGSMLITESVAQFSAVVIIIFLYKKKGLYDE